MKLNDYLLNIISNLEFTNEDFRLVGLDSTNTSLEKKDVYKNLDYIRNLEIFLTDGVFDEYKFDTFYDAVSLGYNELATLDSAKLLGDKLVSSKYNIFADINTVNPNGEFIIHKTLNNPLRLKTSVWGGNLITEGPLSIREIALTLLTSYEDGLKESPNDAGFFGDFFGTKVLATYDSDGVHTDPTTGLQVEHKKGEYKYNHNGTFYYEDLAGRDIYGKLVLSKFDVITTDGSALNTYDFFDSDDKEKGMTGTLMKSVVKVAPAFIPYVGPWYIAARIGLNSMDLFSKIGKMVAGSDSPNLSAIEGFAASLGTSTSDYALEHLWSVENLLNMGADVFLQLAEQRWLFTHLPSLLKGNKLGFDEKARDIWKEKNVSEYLKKLSQRQYGLLSDDMLLIDYALRAKAVGETNRVLEGILKDNYKIGEYISKAYMTGITTASGYSEAKNSGASDTEAMLFTLGLAAGEYGILSTRLGNWILPELQLEKARLLKVIRTLHGLNPGPAASPAAKKNWAMLVIKAGKDWFTSAGFDENTGKVLAKHMVSNSLGEGFEETVEQAWLDIAKSIYNFVGELRGDENTLRQTWRNPDGSLNIANTLNDYALNFVGGLIGGGLGNLKLSFKESQNIANLNDSKAAYQELLYHIREGNGTKLKEVASKMLLGDPTKGTTLVNDYAYAEGTSTDNLDLQAKSVFNGYIDHLTKLVNMERSVKNDKGISLDLVFKDLRFAKLLESETLKSYLLNYHTAVVDLISTASDIRVLQNKGSDSTKLTKTETDLLSALTELYSKAKKTVEEYTDGTQGLEFVKDAIFEMDGGVNNGYIPNNILQYIQFKELSLGYTRKLNEIPKVELEKYIKDWENKAYNLKDLTRALRKWFDANNTLINTHIKNYVFDYLNDADVFIGKVDTAISLKIDENLRVGDSQFANFLQHLYSDKSKEDSDTNYSKRVAIMDALTLELVDTDETFRPLFDLFLAVRRTENAATIALGSDYYNPIVNGLVVTDLRGNSTIYANIIENLMYDAGLMEINDASILSNHDLLYRKAVRLILTNPRVVDHLLNTLKNQGFLSHSARSFLNEFMDLYLDESEAKTLILDTISKIPYTPILNLLDDVQLTLKDSSIKFSTLVSALEAQAFKLSNSGTLNEFGFPAVTWEEAIQHAEDLGNVTLSHLAAARTDLTDPQMPWGYNYTVNQLTKSDDLVTYTVDGFNMLYSDLEKLMNSLSIYKRMVRNSASQLLNSLYNTQASILHRLVSDLKSIFFTLSTDPDNALQNWEKADEFKQALLTLLPESGTSDLETLKEHKGLFTDLDKLRIFLLLFELDNAIFNFMLANKSKTSEDFITLFTKLIPTDRQRLWFIRELDNYEQGNNLHIKTIFSYLAAAGSLSSASFMDFYRKSIKDLKKFIHSNGLYNALFHEVSFLSKKDLWDKMTAAYDAIQLRDLADTSVSDSRVINKGDFYNDSDAKRNTSSALTYKDCFLTTGLSGTGKSSANITLLLSILKNVGNLTNKIAIVHKTLELADDVVKYLVEEAGLGLTSDNFQAFTHESYLNHINPNITPVDPNNPVIDESTLELKDDNTWHYKEEDSLNESAAKFSLVIVDEVTNISHVDLSVHLNYINTNNIRSICLGDFNQTTLQGSFTQSNEIIEHLQIHAHNFFLTLSLMLSFRSTNLLNTNSLLEFLKAVPTILAKEEGHYVKGEGAVDMIYDEDDLIQSNYLLNDHEFGGILVDNVNLNTLDSANKNIEDLIPDDIKLAILHMLNTTSDKIFVLGNHPNNVLYKYLKSLNLESKFEYIDGVALGRESDYAIVITEDSDINSAELGKRYGECLDFFKDTYTAISRARIGSIVTNPKIVNSEYSKRVFKPSKKFTVNKASVLTDQIISEFNSKTIAIFDAILTGVEITPINLDYEITTQESKIPLDIVLLKKEIAEFKKEVEEYNKEDLVPNLPKDKYDKWIESVEKSTLPDGEKIDLLNLIKEFEQYVPTTNNNEGTNFMDADIPYTNTEEDLMIAPIYSFNSYLAGINEEMHIMYGINEEESKEPGNWGGEMLGLRGIIKMLKSEGVDLKDYYDKSNNKPEVKSKAITELHKLYYLLYTGLPIKSPFVPEGYKVVIGFRNTSGTARDMHTSANGKNGTNHRIVAYIMKDSEIKVLIPLYTLPNINAIIESYLVGIATLTDPELTLALITLAVNEILGLNDPSDKLLYLLSKKWDYTALVKLLTIYTNSGSDELFLKKDGDLFIWESSYDPNAEYCTSIRLFLGDASLLLGILVASQTKDSNGYYTYSPEPVKLVEQVNSSKNRVGNIYVHPQAFAFHSDHTIEIKVNSNKVVKKTIPAGKLFVVLSQNPDIRSIYSLDSLLKQVSENKATIVYINCPTLNNNATDDNIEGLVRMFSKDVKSITSHLCILSIANALLDDNVSKYFTNDVIFTEKQRPKLRNSIKILKELVQGLLAGKTWTDTTNDWRPRLGINFSFSNISYGTGVKILTLRLLTNLFDDKVSDSARTDAVTQLFENLKGKPLYFSFEQHGDKQYLEDDEGYYSLNVTFDLYGAGSITATVPNIGSFDVYINGELRTCLEFGNITPILNLVDTPIQQRLLQGPKPQTPMYYKVNGYDFLYKKIDKSGESYVLMNNGEEYKVSLNNMTSTVDPQGLEFTTVTSLSSSHANFKNMFKDYLKLYENNLLDEKISEDQYIFLKFPDYLKLQDGTYKYNDKIYKYDSNTYSMIEQISESLEDAQSNLYTKLMLHTSVIMDLAKFLKNPNKEEGDKIKKKAKNNEYFILQDQDTSTNDSELLAIKSIINATVDYIQNLGDDISYNKLETLLGDYTLEFINKLPCS